MPVTPLLCSAAATLGYVASLILLPSGAVFAATHGAAYAALMQGARIGRRALQVRLHLAIAEVGETSGAVAFSDHPLVGWIGAVTCVLPVAAPGAARSGHLAIGGPGAAAARGTGHR